MFPFVGDSLWCTYTMILSIQKVWQQQLLSSNWLIRSVAMFNKSDPQWSLIVCNACCHKKFPRKAVAVIRKAERKLISLLLPRAQLLRLSAIYYPLVWKSCIHLQPNNVLLIRANCSCIEEKSFHWYFCDSQLLLNSACGWHISIYFNHCYA